MIKIMLKLIITTTQEEAKKAGQEWGALLSTTFLLEAEVLRQVGAIKSAPRAVLILWRLPCRKEALILTTVLNLNRTTVGEVHRAKTQDITS